MKEEEKRVMTEKNAYGINYRRCVGINVKEKETKLDIVGESWRRASDESRLVHAAL